MNTRIVAISALLAAIAAATLAGCSSNNSVPTKSLSVPITVTTATG